MGGVRGATLTPLRRIATFGGDVLHALKASEPEYAGFGEAYFSLIAAGAVKGWKRHRRMTMALTVPHGRVRFAVRDDGGAAEAFILSPAADEHARLTVRPGLWMAFQGLAEGESVVLNLASLEHDAAEADTAPLDAFAWDWAAR